MANPLLDAALAYALRGWAVLPLHDVTAGFCSCKDKRKCQSAGKHPRIVSWPERSTTDPVAIQDFWGMFPNANIGLDVGKAGLLVIDIDPRHGGDETWAALVARHGLPTGTRQTITGGGGCQLYYRAPDGIKIKNQAGVLGPGVDNRAAGGLVVLPPSLHISGKRYAWNMEFTEMLPAPTALLGLLSTRPKTQLNGHTPGGNGNGNGHVPPLVQAELAAEVHALTQAPEGTRNGQLNKSAFLLGQRAGAGLLEPDIIADQLTEAAEAAGLTDGEILPTLNSGLIDGMAEPRDLPSADETKTTDTHNGERLAARYGERLRHVGAWGWLVWDGQRWVRDDTDELDRLAKDTARSIYAEAAAAPSDKAAEKIAAWARASMSRAKIEAMISMAQSEPSIAARPADFDANAWLLNCQNGTLNLRTGALADHKRTDHITHIAPVSFDPAARCDQWDEFLARIFDRDTDLIEFFQRAAGYSLTGDTSEQCWFLCHGTGANGKSTALETLRALLGDYSQQADPAAFLAKRGDGPSNDIARMKGARLVSAVEIGEGRRLAEALVKQMTGGDTLTARFLHHEYFEFKPAFKLWMAANHKPVIRGTDLAIWRRVRLVPFTVTIPEPERDKQLPERLRAELPGILAWAVRGCLAWQTDGLQPPEAVITATDEYRVEMDTLAAFLAECCGQAPNAQATAAGLFKAYQTWGGEDGQRQFGVHLKERGFTTGRTHGGVRTWRGLSLLAGQEDG